MCNDSLWTRSNSECLYSTELYIGIEFSLLKNKIYIWKKCIKDIEIIKYDGCKNFALLHVWYNLNIESDECIL